MTPKEFDWRLQHYRNKQESEARLAYQTAYYCAMNVMNSKPTKPEEYVPGLFGGQKQIQDNKPKRDIFNLPKNEEIKRLRSLMIHAQKKGNTEPKTKTKDGEVLLISDLIERLENE